MGNAQLAGHNDVHRRAIPLPCGTSWFELLNSGLGAGSSLLPCDIRPCRKFTGQEPALFRGVAVQRTAWVLPPSVLTYALGGSVEGTFVQAPARVTFEGGLFQPFLFRGTPTSSPDVALEFQPDTGTAGRIFFATRAGPQGSTEPPIRRRIWPPCPIDC